MFEVGKKYQHKIATHQKLECVYVGTEESVFKSPSNLLHIRGNCQYSEYQEYKEPVIHKSRVALFRTYPGETSYWIEEEYAKRYPVIYSEKFRLTDWVEVEAKER